MLGTDQQLARIAADEFGDVVADAVLIGGSPASPNKLRLNFSDDSFLDIWLSADGDYSYHWEQRRQQGRIYRWDNAPHHPDIATHPAHFHSGDEDIITESSLSADPETALRQVLSFVRKQLGKHDSEGERNS
ncbi:MAG TPA: DUF6516 family protein [Anaerolineales bacterium]|nr:DUF6516 family protein [Anaerolineales bacterium]